MEGISTKPPPKKVRIRQKIRGGKRANRKETKRKLTDEKNYKLKKKKKGWSSGEQGNGRANEGSALLEIFYPIQTGLAAVDASLSVSDPANVKALAQVSLPVR